ncbi:MAG TPA: hypothetical protein VFI53_16585 [Myxococcaceae bacterium]|nr:hypothetical protein [Myxococcaceae bacterium]
MERAFLVCAAAVPLSLGCGFQKTAPIANVCALLSLGDAATLAPGLTTATEQPAQDSQDVWTRACAYRGSGDVVARVDLLVSGALTSAGAQQLADSLSISDPETQVTVVAGLGDRAVYWEHWDYGEGLYAIRGGYGVGLGKTYASNIGEADFKSLVQKVLTQIP